LESWSFLRYKRVSDSFGPLPTAALAVQTSRFDQGVKGSALGGHGSVLGINLDWFNVDEEEKVKAQLVQ